MKLQSRALLCAGVLITVVMCMQAQSAPDRLNGVVVNSAARVALNQNVMPALATAASYAKADDALPMDRMVMLLQPSASQDAALEVLLREQSDPGSPRYQKFLTPSEFADAFGLSSNDIAKVTAWLNAGGFRVDEITPSRRAIVFSGTAAQVTSAFNTEMREYVINGKKHIANAGAPQVPAALAPVIRGLLKLHDFHSRAATASRPLPLNTSGNGSHYLAPADYGIIYNLNTLFNSGVTGVSQSIAVVGRSNVNANDIDVFRSNYALPVANLTPVLATGVDPGFTADSDALEATLDVEWAGAVAPSANVKLVIAPSSSITDGIDLAAQYAVNHKVANILGVSFGVCEANANSAFYNSLWQQASAQGMTVVVAAGDSGAAGCDGPSDAQGTVAAVNALCSTFYNTCVGGTMFNDTANPGQYWLPGNNGSLGSAISYIPETAWNESGAVAGGADLLAGGGGVSKLYLKPYWQSGAGVPADGHRDVPDVSLAAAQHDGYLVVYSGATAVVSGTSAATPAFAGIMALVEQKNGGMQGNINPTLYSLAVRTSSVFHDVTAGSNSVPGVAGFSATTGFDAATGLGSIDAAQLANNWTSTTNQFSFTASGTTIGATPAQSGTLTLTALDSGSFQSTLTLTVLGLPSGVSARFSPATIVGSGSTVLTLLVSGSALSGTTPLTITASGGGITRSVNVNLTVTVSTGCTLTSTPTFISVLQNQSTSVNLTCANPSGVFSNKLALSVSGLPANVTAVLSPTSITAGSGVSSMIVTAGAAALAGTYSATITAVLPGSSPLYSTTLSIPLKVAAPSTFTITPSAGSITLQQASSAVLTLTCVHSGSFNNSISLTLSSMPSGATASLSSTTIAAPGDGVSTLTIQANGITAPGTYTLLVNAQGGNLNVRVPISIQITAAPSFTLTSSMAVATLRQGGNVSLSVATGAPVSGFASAVNLSATGLPAGVTAVFAPASISAPGIGSSVMTLSASSTATTGVFTVTITAAGGVISRNVNLKLTVTPPPTFTLAASIPTYNMIAGGTLTETITVVGLYGYTANVQLSAASTPSALNTSLLSSNVSSNHGTTTLTIQAPSATAVGVYVVTVTGVDSSANIMQTATMNILVGSVTATLNSPSINLPIRGSATGVITVTTQSFSGLVNLSLSTLPLGVTYTLSSPSVLTSGSSTLTLSAAGTTLPGTYIVNVRAIAGGVTTTVPLTLVIS